MKMKNKKKSIIAVIAILTAVIGAIVAIGAYLKRKAEDIGEKLDFDGNLYYEDDDYFDETEPELKKEEPSIQPVDNQPVTEENAEQEETSIE